MGRWRGLVGDVSFYVVGVEAGVTAELVEADVLVVLLVVVLSDLGQDAAAGTAALAGDALDVLGVYADSFYFHGIGGVG